MKTIAWPQLVLFFTLIIVFCETKLFQSGWRVFVLLCGNSGGIGGVGGWGHQFLTNMENPGRWGVLSETASVVGYGYFLEPHI